MYKNTILNLLIFLSGICFVVTTNVEECKNIPTPIVNVENCKVAPCDVVKGTEAAMTVSFNATEYTNNLEMIVHALIGPFPLPYPLDDSIGNVCKNLLNTHCPLEENEPGVYQLRMPINDEYPSITVRLRFNIQDGKKKMACFIVAIKVIG